MRFCPRSRWTFSRAGSLGLFLVLAACEGTEGGGGGLEGLQTLRQAALKVNDAGADGPGTVPEDNLATYAAKCEAATGIRVPTFNCNAGTEVPQGSSIDNIELQGAIGPGGGSRTVPDPVNQPTTYSITAGGNGIANSSDQFYYAYVDVARFAGKAEVKVTSLTNKTAATKAGVMVRNGGTTAGAVNVMLALTQTGLVVQHRDTINMGTTVGTNQAVTLPIWLRLTWNSTNVVAQTSTDHSHWTQVGPTLNMANFDPTQAVVGLAVSSTTAGFEKFMTTKKCDRPNVLNNQCDPSSKFQVLVRTADAIAVANCRKVGQTDDAMFNDLAVIQYNRVNGATCFYQSPNGVNGTNVTAPILGTGANLFPWLTPQTTHDAHCTGCHDSSALIRSPYLWQLGLLPGSYWTPPYVNEGYENDGSNPLRYVGIAFDQDLSWTVNANKSGTDSGSNCNTCHNLAFNAQDPTGGTAIRFAWKATSVDQTIEVDTGSHKNPVSATSPLWMRPVTQAAPAGQTSYSPGAWATAKNFKKCAENFINNGYSPPTGDPEMLGCSYQDFGQAYLRPLDSTEDLNVGTSGGTATGSLEKATLISPANTDIFGTADKFFWTSAIQGFDGTAVVKVTRLDPTDPYAKAGIMVRAGSAVGAVNVMIAVTASKGATFQWRSTANGTTQVSPYLTGVGMAAPIWLKIARSGTTWVGSVSADSGLTWQQVGQPVTLPDLIYPQFVGLTTTSHTAAPPAGTTGRADFEAFDWTNSMGWTEPHDPHLFVDASIAPAGLTSSGTRKENKIVETMTSTGGDISGTGDQFTYAFKTFTLDGVATTKVTSQTGTPTVDQYVKAGIMIRENGTANARNVFVGKTRDGATFQSRSTAGGTTTPTNVTSPAAPVWFRMVRTGNTFYGSMSGDGNIWTPVGDPVYLVNFVQSPLVGLALSSHGTAVTTATFDSGATTLSQLGTVVPAADPPGLQWSSVLPAWIDTGIGITGSTHQSSAGTETITASGTDIYNYVDQFFMAFKNVTGPATIIAQVNSLTAVSGTIDPYAKAGVMFRDSSTSGAPNAMMAMTSGHGSTFQNRSVAGALTATPTFGTGAAPYWVRLVRSANNTYTGYASSTNGNWGTPVGSVQMNTIGTTALVGLAVTSHNASQTVRSVFSNVTISQP